MAGEVEATIPKWSRGRQFALTWAICWQRREAKLHGSGE